MFNSIFSSFRGLSEINGKCSRKRRSLWEHWWFLALEAGMPNSGSIFVPIWTSFKMWYEIVTFCKTSSLPIRLAWASCNASIFSFKFLSASSCKKINLACLLKTKKSGGKNPVQYKLSWRLPSVRDIQRSQHIHFWDISKKKIKQQYRLALQCPA